MGASEHQPFDATGTVLRIVSAPSVGEAMEMVDGEFGNRLEAPLAQSDHSLKQYAAFRTPAITGYDKIIWLDMSWLKDSDKGPLVDLVNGEAIQVELLEQADGSFLAVRYWALVKGSKQNNTDWGVQESNTTRDDSIEARVDNVPDDDEARAQGDRFDDKGRRVDHDDD
jgi:hypothetical protein